MKTYDIDCKDTICALATPPGTSAISVIRISGKNAMRICNKIFHPSDKKKSFLKVKSHTIHHGTIIDNKMIIDDVIAAVYKNPTSYTSEDSIEFSCHGSYFIQQKILEALTHHGCRLALPGEFTLRAFLNKKLDLSQAEAVADLISSHSKTSHKLALQQMRGGYSSKIKELRDKLIEFSSLIELELDFSEEDVEFADKKKLHSLILKIKNNISELKKSFSLGNVLKNGIPVTIIGKPNVGKSTLLNALLNEEKAIVSEIPGTTRDIIEDTLTIDGTTFRFIDTAGLRKGGNDKIENIGIERTYEKIKQASVILLVCDITNTSVEKIISSLDDFKHHIEKGEVKKIILIVNKLDLLAKTPKELNNLLDMETIFISAKRKTNINLIIDSLKEFVVNEQYIQNEPIISNIRHYEALTKTFEAVQNIEGGLDKNISSDLLTVDIHSALHYLGMITGEVTTEEILENVFSNFCIGK